MSFEPNPPMMFSEPIGPWHNHFAWFPVRTYDGQFVWLQEVRRRPCALYSNNSWFWQYHAPATRRTA